MSIVGSPGSEDRKKFIAYCAFGIIFVGYIYFQFFRDSTPANIPPSAPVITTTSVTGGGAEASTVSAPITPRVAANSGSTAKVVGVTSAALDPTLHMDAMLVTESVAYSGTGRNIFSAMSAPPPVMIQKPIAPARVSTLVPPTVYRDPGPPPPPPINLKFIGTLESPPGSGARKAFLLHDDDVVLASAGDTVLRRYRVISVSANSIEIEDMLNNNKQTLPLLAN